MGTAPESARLHGAHPAIGEQGGIDISTSDPGLNIVMFKCGMETVLTPSGSAVPLAKTLFASSPIWNYSSTASARSATENTPLCALPAVGPDVIT